MRAKEVRGMGDADLLKRKEEIKSELVKENAQIATGTTPKSPGQVRNMKRTIAKINMVLGERKRKK